VVALASALLALALAYAYAWIPMTRERDRLVVRVPELRAEMQAMERDARELEKLNARAPAPVGMRSAIQRASSTSRLPDAAVEIVPLDSTTVRVAIASLSAEQGFRWIAHLQSDAAHGRWKVSLVPFE
jgi:type II secretory pathway component PulM